MRRIFLCVVVILPACASTDKVVLPSWATQHLENLASADHECAVPVGVFSNSGETTYKDGKPEPLAAMLFDDALAGYPVEAIAISAVPGSAQLAITGVLDGVTLNRTRVIEPADENCDKRWYVKTASPIDATLRTEAIMYTAGLVVPLNETKHLHLFLAADGSLLMKVQTRAWVLGALVIPVKIDFDYWLRYPRLMPDDAAKVGSREDGS